MQKKILLIYPPVINQVRTINIPAFDKAIGAYPPLGLLYIAAYLKDNSEYAVEILDCFAGRLDFQAIKAEVEKRKPDIIGISAMTHFWVDVVEIAKLAKEILPYSKIIVGGAHATIYPISTVKNAYIDYAVCGEGEFCFKELADALFEQLPEEDIALIPGVASKLLVSKHKTNADIEHQRIDDLNGLPFPDRRLLDSERYFYPFAKRGTFTTLISSRGCPFHCIFCDRVGKDFRSVNAENVLKEIKNCMGLGFRHFFFHDDTFTVNAQRVKEICTAITREHLEIVWQARSRVDRIDYGLLKIMKQAGLSRISFGVESGNERILASLGKGISLDRVREVFGWCRQLKIITLADFMLGSPGETRDDINDTLRFIRRINPDYVQFSITCPYPATPLYKKLLGEGRIDRDVWLEFAENPDVNFSPPLASEYFNRAQLEKIAARAYRKVYFSLPFIFKELKKIRSAEMLWTRLRSGFFLLKG